MTNPSPSLAELEQRIAIARDNIRQLIEQAAALSGAEDEDRNADRIARAELIAGRGKRGWTPNMASACTRTVRRWRKSSQDRTGDTRNERERNG
jgi:hypothetical protein